MTDRVIHPYEAERRKFTKQNLLDGRLIARNRDIMSGAYTLRGTRLTVRNLRGMHRGGDSVVKIAESYNLAPEVVHFVIKNWRGK